MAYCKRHIQPFVYVTKHRNVSEGVSECNLFGKENHLCEGAAMTVDLTLTCLCFTYIEGVVLPFSLFILSFTLLNSIGNTCCPNQPFCHIFPLRFCLVRGRGDREYNVTKDNTCSPNCDAVEKYLR